MATPIVHWEISAKDAKLLQGFYSNLFEWIIDANNPVQYGMVNTGSKAGIGGGIYQKNEQQPSGTVIYAAVKDLQACLDKVVALGGKVIVPITEIPNMVTFALFTDIEGNVMGLVKDDPTMIEKPKAKKSTRKSKKIKRIVKPKPKANIKARK